MGPGDLSAALAPLPREDDPRLLVGRETFDDAGVFRLSDDLALVQTVDFFAPIVDDPYRFGRIAAANALSDVFAMGGEPLTAMNIVGFPEKALPLSVLTEILRGGQDAVHEAGARIVGGHTVTDEELKYGLSVTGRVHPDRILSNAHARPGDVLLLTKPIGTGILATAGKRGALTPEQDERLYHTMSTLNAAASRAAVAVGARCATDITGFGLLGHAMHVARASAVRLVIAVQTVPLLDGARELLAAGHATGGAKRNAEWVAPEVDWNDTGEEWRALLCDPQTSGGLLVALAPERVAAYRERMSDAVVIGAVEEWHEGARIRLH
ncbi:MAG: selenide, water dikinase SelD [Gemmatimonadetes bacterium]|jgi:selenide,water dikinase|nr:selenide, water dikinase SelD [Gemmatimonadota bacterium]MBP7548885.1 selenide, water dikinase SelD [Gemmatimonadaceae bacterium]